MGNFIFIAPEIIVIIRIAIKQGISKKNSIEQEPQVMDLRICPPILFLLFKISQNIVIL